IDHAVLAPDLSASVSFPDAALEGAIRTALSKPTGTLVLGDVYTPAFTELHAADTGIVSLEGLQHCRFLKSLWLGRNNIVTLTPLST
ncbi:leucine-rich repeat domain-containing protein, partial [Klebsiella pneumoniae]|uniref:leucine-rich repeat domain-containing protein n=1 Tax=Klebsiella pneumoniae TaxID=573 RepID=UPI002731D9E2